MRFFGSAAETRCQSRLRSGCGNDGPDALTIAERPLFRVQAQAGLACTYGRPVTCVTVLREDRPDIAVELNLARILARSLAGINASEQRRAAEHKE
jgi:hypothetical protein